MHTGEIVRLGLRPGLCLRLVGASPVHWHPMRCALLAAALLASPPGQRTSQAAPPTGPGAAVAPIPGPLDLAQPLAARTLQRLENEAENRYRMPGAAEGVAGQPDQGGAGDDAELVRMYETLAQLAADRAPQAWLRIGNVYQRSGSVGAAIDAYRRLLDVAPPAGARAAEAAAAERKALLNLAALALEQAGLALSRLETLGGPPSPMGAHARELQKLEDRLVGQRSHAQGSAPVAASPVEPITSAQPPQIVERYTASARRNAIRTARGSLQANPGQALPRVEYLLGDPNRAKAAASDTAEGHGRRSGGKPGERSR